MQAPPVAQPTVLPPRIRINSWIVLIILLLGFFMILLDSTIVNVAIPQMERGLNTTFDRILWVLNGYVLVYAVLLITAGRLGDMFGAKRLFLVGLTLFTLSSAACGFAGSANELIAFRLVQGVGGALLAPQTLSIITNIFPAEQRGVAFGLWGAVAGIAATVGPVLGGFLVTNFAWQAVFFINVPVGIFTVVAVMLVMPDPRSMARHRLDLPGVVLISVGLFLGVFALIEGQTYSWGPITSAGSFSIGDTRWSILSIYSFLVYSVVLLGVFIFKELRTEEPLLPLGLLRIRNFALGNGIYFLVGAAIFPLFTPIAIFLQTALGYTAIHTGLTTVPLSLGVLFASPVTGKLADRGYGKNVVLVGCVLFIAGVLVLRQSLALNDTSWTLAIPFAIMGIGMGAVFAPLTTVMMSGVQASEAGSASGFLNMLQQTGGALGIAVVGAVLSKSVAADLPNQAAKVAGQVPTSYRGHFVSGWQAASHGSQQFGAGQSGGVHLPAGIPAAVARQIGALDFHVFTSALLTGTKAALIVAPIGMLLAFGLAALMRPSPAAEGEPTEEDETATSRVPQTVT
jgi:EmrB/QacA subfamily drug resistance transporter